MKFDLGQVVVTPRVSSALEQCGLTVDVLLARHQAGDWGDVSDVEKRMNDDAVGAKFNLISNYVTSSGENVRVFTKADRSCTHVHITPRVTSPAAR